MGKKKELCDVSNTESLSEVEKRRKRNKKGKRKTALWCNAFYGVKQHMQTQHHPALTDWLIVPEL